VTGALTPTEIEVATGIYGAVLKTIIPQN